MIKFSKEFSLESISENESPVYSTTNKDCGSPSIKSIILEYTILDFACLRIISPIISTAEGFDSKTKGVASIDLNISSKCITPNALIFGISTKFTFASVIVSNVPSEPVTNLAILRFPGEINSSKLYPDTLL